MLLMVFNDRHFDEIWRFHGKKHLQNFCKKNVHFLVKLKVSFSYIFCSNSETTKARNYCYTFFESSDPNI